MVVQLGKNCSLLPRPWTLSTALAALSSRHSPPPMLPDTVSPGAFTGLCTVDLFPSYLYPSGHLRFSFLNHNPVNHLESCFSSFKHVLIPPVCFSLLSRSLGLCGFYALGFIPLP